MSIDIDKKLVKQYESPTKLGGGKTHIQTLYKDVDRIYIYTKIRRLLDSELVLVNRCKNLIYPRNKRNIIQISNHQK